MPVSRDQKRVGHWGKILVEYKGKLISNPPLVLCAHKGKDQSSSLCKESCAVKENHLNGLLALQR